MMGSGFVVLGWKVSGYPVDLRFTFCALEFAKEAP
jgi:hypothetical protein